MALQLNLTRAVASPGARLQLVQAVLAAPPHEPETDYIEWKDGVDLQAWKPLIARYILGFANREVALAARFMEGTAYLVIGASPGSLTGVTPADPAHLLDWINPYTGGASGPQWDPNYVELGGKTVLVITVAAPRDGDRAWPFRRKFEGRVGTREVTIREGIYIRRNGKTEEATAADHDRLAARAASTGNRIGVRVEFGGKGQRIAAVELPGEVPRAEWVTAEIERQLAATAPLPSWVPDPSKFTSALLGLGRDPRTAEEYRSEVEEWGTKAKTQLLTELVSRAIERNLGLVQLQLVNLTDRNFREVEVTVRIDGALEAYESVRDVPGERLTARPKAWGTATLHEALRFGMGAFPELSRLSAFDDFPSVGPGLRIDNSGSAVLTYPPYHLRPGEVVQLDDVHLVVGHHHAGGQLEARWHATSSTASGWSEDSLSVEVEPEPVTTDELMASVDEDEGDEAEE